jgi:hypothetical protein
MISGLKKYLKKPADDGKGGDGVMKLDSITEFEEYDESQGERYSAEEFYATVDLQWHGDRTLQGWKIKASHSRKS